MLKEHCKIYFILIWMPPGQIWSDLVLADKVLWISIGIVSSNWPDFVDMILSHAIIVT